jgi:trigger factor
MGKEKDWPQSFKNRVGVKNLEKSQIELEFELTAEEFSGYIDKALGRLGQGFKADGFRKGNVPKEIVERQIRPENLLMEAGDLAVKESYGKFIRESKLEPIGGPEVQILKIAKGNPFLFKIKVSILPDVELPDYKKLAGQVREQEISVTEQDIEESINYLQRSRAKFTDKPDGAEKNNYIKIEYQNENINGGKAVRDIFILGQGGFLKDFEDNLIGMKTGEEKEFTAKFPENAPNGMGGREGRFKVKMLAVQIMDLPEVNDNFAKSIGAFDSLIGMKNSLREGITIEKKQTEKLRKRGEILEKILANTKFDLPEKMVEYEEKRLFEEMKNQIAQNAKIDFGEYLKSIKKTEEEIKKSFRLEAERRVKNFLVLRQVGKLEKIEIESSELEEEMNKIIKNYSKEQLDKIDIRQLKEYSREVVMNEKIFQFLENYSH